MYIKKEPLPAPPEREELREVPKAPRLIIEISRLLRFRVRQEVNEGVMAQNTARLVLSHLAVQDRVTQLELVRLTRLKAPTVSVLLRRMEAEGYVTRTPDEEDRRAVRVSLTEKGREFDRRHLSRISTNDHAAMAGFTAEEEALLLSLLSRIRDNLSER
ncbi:MAG: winged helix DNA-binding protein [Clostridia bacterium]|nr:winged helix DNA-binding protein [Clostridia bacterium]